MNMIAFEPLPKTSIAVMAIGLIIMVLFLVFIYKFSPKTDGSVDENRKATKKGLAAAFTLLFLGITVFLGGGILYNYDQKEAANAFLSKIEEQTEVSIIGKDAYSYKDLTSLDENAVNINYRYDNSLYEGVIFIEEGVGQLMIPLNSKESKYIPFDGNLLSNTP